ncbi:complement C3-like [Pholidichthys leucotaenia]
MKSTQAIKVTKVMTAPNLLRVGTRENIFVECQDCSDENDFTVEISVMNYPARSKRLTSTSVNLTSVNKFQDFGQIKIPTEEFSRDSDMKHYVYLQALFPDVKLEKLVLVSFHSGYIFIQTDKTLYTPNSKVHFRIFAVTPDMEPVERDDITITDASIRIEFVNPEGITFPIDTVSVKSGVHSGHFHLAETVSTGLWKVMARFHTKPLTSYSAEFEVKHYVLPNFEVKLIHQSPFFYVDSEELTINIKATYVFGEEVDGSAYAVFGVIHQDQKKTFPGSLQRVKIEKSEGTVMLKREQITEIFENILELVGCSIFVAVSVMTEDGSELAEAELAGIPIVTSPYTIHFRKTPRYFKPGMSFDAAVKTDDPRISPERQASASMTVFPYRSQSNNYIHIGVTTAEVKPGEHFKINLNLNKPENTDNDITYLLLSRGRLVKYGRYRITGQVLISVIIAVTRDLMPSFRIIAYYHPNDNEVVSDSVWVDVKDSCMGSLKLEPTHLASVYEPRKLFGLKVTGDPGATVGLVAVDKGVYILNKHRLTQKKIWDVIERYDPGCTPGGGKDGMSVFFDAGLLFESNMVSGTPYRQVSQYKDQLQRECCLDGMRETPLSYSCERRSEYISDSPACVEAFLHCCKEIQVHQNEKKKESLKLARSDDDDRHFMDSNEIVSRSYFPESWLWSDIKLPACPEKRPNCETTSFLKDFPLQDSITTWEFIGISLSKSYGICIADPLEVIVRKDFFVDLKLPRFAVHGEQIEIKAILHNNSPNLLTVRVDLIEETHVCSAASKRGKFTQDIEVGAQMTHSVPFIVVPIKEGKYYIEVKASVKDSVVSDGIRKMLHVVKGQQMQSRQHKEQGQSWEVERQKGGKQVEIINSRISQKKFVPNTPTITQIYLTGENEANVLKNAISGKEMGNLIYKPSGSGEENMIHMTMSVSATMYLDKANEWDYVGIDRRDEALRHITTGYQTQLPYRKRAGSFARSPDHQSSTWLTAYVVKVFAMANNLIAVESEVICDAIKFLIVNTQEPPGFFREVGSVYHTEMVGDIYGSDSDASMTAFCLIAIQESRTLCSATINSLKGNIDKAVAYLEKRLPSLINPYAVAMTSYALANEKKLNQEVLYMFSSPDSSHWPVPAGRAYTLEATAYALLALVKTKTFEEAKPVVRWFNKQKRENGGFGSTQATMMVYQALADFWASDKEQDYDLNVDILLPGRSRPDKYNINWENHHATRTSKLNLINRDVKVTATGPGKATVTMLSMYYILPEENDSDCQKFNLYKDKKHDAPMAILDIGQLTGFSFSTKDLDLLSKGRARTISKYRLDTTSERGSLIIHLRKVSHTKPEEITFRIHQKLKVGILQPAAVSIYEFSHDLYSDQTKCVKFYHPERRAGELLLLCRNEECTCAEENCSMQRKGKISNEDREEKICETKLNSRIDFAYKVRLDEFTDGLSTDIYTVRVLEVIKDGGYDFNVWGKTRTFLSYTHCRMALDLRLGKTYLIMGTSKDIYKDERSQWYHYVLGERTWIEYWPTETECETKNYASTDHTALTSLLETARLGHKPLHIYRWTERLQAYNFNTQFTPGRENVAADPLSQATPNPTLNGDQDPLEPELIHMLHGPIQNAISLQELQAASEQDPTLTQLHAFIHEGWPSIMLGELASFHRFKDDLSYWNNICVARGHCMMIPEALKGRILTMVHKGHLGVVRVKQRCRGSV